MRILVFSSWTLIPQNVSLATEEWLRLLPKSPHEPLDSFQCRPKQKLRASEREEVLENDVQLLIRSRGQLEAIFKRALWAEEGARVW